MSTSPAITETDPQQGLKDNKATLEDKLKRLESIKTADIGFDVNASIERAKRQLAEVNKALRKETK
jgi:hypothetical protein